jgi:ABC-type transporter Mla subunit MlaD
MASLYELQGDFLQIEQILDDNGGEVTEELAQLFTDTALSIQQKVDGYRVVMAKFNDKADAIDKEIKRLQGLKKTAVNAEKRLKEYILNVMGTYGLKKIEGLFCSMTRTTSKALDVNEELLLSAYNEKIAELQAQLPDYLTIEVKVSKTAIKNKFKDTDVLPAGCAYMENESLRIR